MLHGSQIACIPDHAKGDINHPDVKFGFTIGEYGDKTWCRYWIKDKSGELRTVANSELTPSRYLVEYKSVTDEVVEQALRQIGSTMIYGQ